jgi:hypothetical protein
MKKKGLLLFILFCIYACITIIIDPAWKTKNIQISIPFICGITALLVVLATLFMDRKIFEIALPVFLLGSVFYFETYPFSVSITTYRINSIPLFYGKPIPALFLLVYIIVYFKEIRILLQKRNPS